MSRYIDADALYELIDGGYDVDFDEVPETKKALLAMIDYQETADVRENVRGKWNKREAWRNGIRIRIRRCSNCCGAKPLQVFDAEDEEFSYCPYCGARMDKVEGEEDGET